MVAFVALLMCLLAAGNASAQEIPQVKFTIERFEVSGENPLSDAETQAILQSFTGDHAGLEGLLAAADALEAAIKDTGPSFISVILPGQTLQDGVVRLEVIALTVSKVTVTGAQHNTEENILRTVPDLEQGGQPNTDRLARSLELANRNASKEATLTFRENQEEPGTLEAALEVEDKRAWSVFLSGDNSGSEDIGTAQTTLGASHNNLFDIDHAVSLSYTTAPEESDNLQQWAVSYYMPFYSVGGSLLLYHVESDVDSGVALDLFEISGSGQFSGLRYSHEFYRSGSLTHRIAIGLDDKLFENDVLLDDSNLATDVRSQPASLQYSGEIDAYPWSADFRIAYDSNIPGGDRNSTPFY